MKLLTFFYNWLTGMGRVPLLRRVEVLAELKKVFGELDLVGEGPMPPNSDGNFKNFDLLYIREIEGDLPGPISW
ncbi:hypothetical protein BGS_1275 [Beggiatoa sp. SS]|nr:hypothetical protein BGS_1275 [Beggiatoa sp. SS]